MKNIKPIKTEIEYQVSLLRLETIFDAPANSDLGDEAEILSILIENYENQHYSFDSPHPIEAIKIRMEEKELKQKDLIGIIGSKSKVSEVLNRKRKLTLKMIRRLSETLEISPSTLVKDYELDSTVIAA